MSAVGAVSRQAQLTAIQSSNEHGGKNGRHTCPLLSIPAAPGCYLGQVRSRRAHRDLLTTPQSGEVSLCVSGGRFWTNLCPCKHLVSNAPAERRFSGLRRRQKVPMGSPASLATRIAPWYSRNRREKPGAPTFLTSPSALHARRRQPGTRSGKSKRSTRLAYPVSSGRTRVLFGLLTKPESP